VSSALDVSWSTHARQLADTLLSNGDLRATQWHAAVSAVPRHLLVPRAYEQDNTGAWREFETAENLKRVYSSETLITALETVGDHKSPISSSTKPDLMVRMLELLDVREGDRVLEIGTGTGYNAALLAHRLGDDCVFSVDVGQDLVEVARERLSAAGFHPTLAAVNGAHGLPGSAPFDRIIATCSVPRVPWQWAQQLTPDGLILVDLKLAVSAGNLVLLRHVDGGLQGRFTARWAAFMAMRSGEAREPVTRVEKAAAGRTRPTAAPSAPWSDAPISWFLAHLRLPRGVSIGYDLDPNTMRPTAATLTALDGSWARAAFGDGTVTEAGETPIWPHIEWAHEQWTAAGRPPWERLGLTVTSDGAHHLWLDDPRSGSRWELPPVD
jgi:protein-L-isoaspartate O-methyltransferase